MKVARQHEMEEHQTMIFLIPWDRHPRRLDGIATFVGRDAFMHITLTVSRPARVVSLPPRG